MWFIPVVFYLLLFVLIFPFAIVRFAYFIARTSMDSEMVRLYGEMSAEDRNSILTELRRRGWISFAISLPLALYLEWLWIRYLYSFFPFLG